MKNHRPEKFGLHWHPGADTNAQARIFTKHNDNQTIADLPIAKSLMRMISRSQQMTQQMTIGCSMAAILNNSRHLISKWKWSPKLKSKLLKNRQCPTVPSRNLVKLFSRSQWQVEVTPHQANKTETKAKECSMALVKDLTSQISNVTT